MRGTAASGRGLLLLLVTVLVAACGGPSGSPMPTPRLFRTVLSHGDTPSVPVVLSDSTGLVTALGPQIDPRSDEREPALLADPSEPNAFEITWLGGLCDEEIDLEFAPAEDGFTLRLNVHASGSCPAAGVSRGVRIVASRAIPLATIVVTRS